MRTTHKRHKIGGIEHYNGLGMSPRPTRTHQELLADALECFRKKLKKKGYSLTEVTQLL